MTEIRTVVKEWPSLALHLGVPKYVIDLIEKDFVRDTERQKMEAMDWWMKNVKKASWMAC